MVIDPQSKFSGKKALYTFHGVPISSTLTETTGILNIIKFVTLPYSRTMCHGEDHIDEN